MSVKVRAPAEGCGGGWGNGGHNDFHSNEFLVSVVPQEVAISIPLDNGLTCVPPPSLPCILPTFQISVKFAESG